MKLGAGARLQPGLHAVLVVPHDAFEKRVDKTHQQKRRRQLRAELGALGDAAGHDCRNRRGKCQQEEKLDQFVAAFFHELLRAAEKIDAIGERVADEKIGDGGHGEIAQDFHQRVDLAFAAHGAQFEKRKPRMHRKHEDRAEQNKQYVAACF